MLSFLASPTRHLFFTGKGGVGKTSLACSTAIYLADTGKRVLLVSTDPASNLDQVLEQSILPTIARVESVPNLSAVNIDPRAAAQSYRDRVITPVKDILPESVVSQMTEQLSGACTVEIAAFDAFTNLLVDPQLWAEYDNIVFDTAPTGHTLRLLQLPAAWSEFIDENPDGASCLGPLSGLDAQQSQYAAAVRTLGDQAQSTFILVTRPERSALAEAGKTSEDLSGLGLLNQALVVNGVLNGESSDDPLANAIVRRQDQALSETPESIKRLQTDFITLRSHNLLGLDALRSLISGECRHPEVNATSFPIPQTPSLSELTEQVEREGHGLILVMGKGGVGKTTVAAAIATELALQGNQVHLSTTDPAAHIQDVAGEIDGLSVSRIDPKEVTEQYIRKVLETKGSQLDDAGRKLLEEDLKSPCTEEVAVFNAFSAVVREAARGFVVLDTAPTGHTLLLLDQTGAYHKEVLRNTQLNADAITTPLMRLQDPSYTRLIVVTLPETTPVTEAEELQEDLARAGINPFAWVINQSLSASDTSDPILSSRAQAEGELIHRVITKLSDRTVILPVEPDAPVGVERLSDLAKGRISHSNLQLG